MEPTLCDTIPHRFHLNQKNLVLPLESFSSSKLVLVGSEARVSGSPRANLGTTLLSHRRAVPPSPCTAAPHLGTRLAPTRSPPSPRTIAQRQSLPRDAAAFLAPPGHGRPLALTRLLPIPQVQTTRRRPATSPSLHAAMACYGPSVALSRSSPSPRATEPQPSSRADPVTARSPRGRRRGGEQPCYYPSPHAGLLPPRYSSSLASFFDGATSHFTLVEVKFCHQSWEKMDKIILIY